MGIELSELGREAIAKTKTNVIALLETPTDEATKEQIIAASTMLQLFINAQNEIDQKESPKEKKSGGFFSSVTSAFSSVVTAGINSVTGQPLITELVKKQANFNTAFKSLNREDDSWSIAIKDEQGKELAILMHRLLEDFCKNWKKYTKNGQKIDEAVSVAGKRKIPKAVISNAMKQIQNRIDLYETIKKAEDLKAECDAIITHYKEINQNLENEIEKYSKEQLLQIRNQAISDIKKFTTYPSSILLRAKNTGKDGYVVLRTDEYDVNGGCNRILMLEKMPEEKQIDKNAIYLIDDGESITINFYKADKFNSKEYRGNREKLTEYFKDQNEIKRDYQKDYDSFKQVVSLIDYSPILKRASNASMLAASNISSILKVIPDLNQKLILAGERPVKISDHIKVELIDDNYVTDFQAKAQKYLKSNPAYYKVTAINHILDAINELKPHKLTKEKFEKFFGKEYLELQKQYWLLKYLIKRVPKTSDEIVNAAKQKYIQKLETYIKVTDIVSFFKENGIISKSLKTKIGLEKFFDEPNKSEYKVDTLLKLFDTNIKLQLTDEQIFSPSSIITHKLLRKVKEAEELNNQLSSEKANDIGQTAELISDLYSKLLEQFSSTTGKNDYLSLVRAQEAQVQTDAYIEQEELINHKKVEYATSEELSQTITPRASSSTTATNSSSTSSTSSRTASSTTAHSRISSQVEHEAYSDDERNEKAKAKKELEKSEESSEEKSHQPTDAGEDSGEKSEKPNDAQESSYTDQAETATTFEFVGDFTAEGVFVPKDSDAEQNTNRIIATTGEGFKFDPPTQPEKIESKILVINSYEEYLKNWVAGIYDTVEKHNSAIFEVLKHPYPEQGGRFSQKDILSHDQWVKLSNAWSNKANLVTKDLGERLEKIQVDINNSEFLKRPKVNSKDTIATNVKKDSEKIEESPVSSDLDLANKIKDILIRKFTFDESDNLENRYKEILSLVKNKSDTEKENILNLAFKGIDYLKLQPLHRIIKISPFTENEKNQDSKEYIYIQDILSQKLSKLKELSEKFNKILTAKEHDNIQILIALVNLVKENKEYLLFFRENLNRDDIHCIQRCLLDFAIDTETDKNILTPEFIKCLNQINVYTVKEKEGEGYDVNVEVKSNNPLGVEIHKFFESVKLLRDSEKYSSWVDKLQPSTYIILKHLMSGYKSTDGKLVPGFINLIVEYLKLDEKHEELLPLAFINELIYRFEEAMAKKHGAGWTLSEPKKVKIFPPRPELDSILVIKIKKILIQPLSAEQTVDSIYKQIQVLIKNINNADRIKNIIKLAFEEIDGSQVQGLHDKILATKNAASSSSTSTTSSATSTSTTSQSTLDDSSVIESKKEEEEKEENDSTSSGESDGEDDESSSSSESEKEVDERAQELQGIIYIESCLRENLSKLFEETQSSPNNSSSTSSGSIEKQEKQEKQKDDDPLANYLKSYRNKEFKVPEDHTQAIKKLVENESLGVFDGMFNDCNDIAELKELKQAWENVPKSEIVKGYFGQFSTVKQYINARIDFLEKEPKIQERLAKQDCQNLINLVSDENEKEILLTILRRILALPEVDASAILSNPYFINFVALYGKHGEVFQYMTPLSELEHYTRSNQTDTGLINNANFQKIVCHVHYRRLSRDSKRISIGNSNYNGQNQGGIDKLYFNDASVSVLKDVNKEDVKEYTYYTKQYELELHPISVILKKPTTKTYTKTNQLIELVNFVQKNKNCLLLLRDRLDDKKTLEIKYLLVNFAKTEIDKQILTSEFLECLNKINACTTYRLYHSYTHSTIESQKHQLFNLRQHACDPLLRAKSDFLNKVNALIKESDFNLEQSTHAVFQLLISGYKSADEKLVPGIVHLIAEYLKLDEENEKLIPLSFVNQLIYRIENPKDKITEIFPPRPELDSILAIKIKKILIEPFSENKDFNYKYALIHELVKDINEPERIQKIIDLAFSKIKYSEVQVLHQKMDKLEPPRKEDFDSGSMFQTAQTIRSALSQNLLVLSNANKNSSSVDGGELSDNNEDEDEEVRSPFQDEDSSAKIKDTLKKKISEHYTVQDLLSELNDAGFSEKNYSQAVSDGINSLSLENAWNLRFELLAHQKEAKSKNQGKDYENIVSVLIKKLNAKADMKEPLEEEEKCRDYLKALQTHILGQASLKNGWGVESKFFKSSKKVLPNEDKYKKLSRKDFPTHVNQMMNVMTSVAQYKMSAQNAYREIIKTSLRAKLAVMTVGRSTVTSDFYKNLLFENLHINADNSVKAIYEYIEDNIKNKKFNAINWDGVPESVSKIYNIIDEGNKNRVDNKIILLNVLKVAIEAEEAILPSRHRTAFTWDFYKQGIYSLLEVEKVKPAQSQGLSKGF